MQFYEANPEPTLKRFALCEENSLLNKGLCFEAIFPHGTTFDLIGEIDISQADDMYTNQTCTIRKDRGKYIFRKRNDYVL